MDWDPGNSAELHRRARLAAAIACEGLAGPVLLQLGLRFTPASAASLLLNMEGVFTALLAWFVFRENFDLRIAIGMALISAGALTLSWSGPPELWAPWGALSIAGACLAWAADNNLTRKVSGADPVHIATLKELCAGGVNTNTEPQTAGSSMQLCRTIEPGHDPSVVWNRGGKQLILSRDDLSVVPESEFPAVKLRLNFRR